MIRSMTGFGRGEAQGEGLDFLVEIKSINHRYCDVFVKMPRQISFLEDKVRDYISKSLSRGKIDVFISMDDRSADSKTVVVDEVLAGAYVKAAEMLKEKYKLKDDISVSMISRFQDVFKIEKAEADEEELWKLLKSALENSVNNLVSMREIEGEGLKNIIFERVDYIETIVKDISTRAPEVVKEYKLKIETRIKELLEQQNIDENRIAMEVAVFADRCSIDEELVRLGSHISQFRETLSLSQPVGRKLDFLMQELNRETNTIGSKANDLLITRNVVEIKSELEKIREQIQNIE